MKIKNILISQPEPADIEKTPYGDLQRKYGVTFHFFKFISIEGIEGRDFRKERINILDHTAVIFTSRLAVDHFFRISKELRVEIPDTMKYFCTTESTALYLQKYIQYRKRKIFFSNSKHEDLIKLMVKHKEEKYLLPCTDVNKGNFVEELENNSINFRRATLYRTLPSDFSHIDMDKFDMLVFFSPYGIEALMDAVPGFVQEEKVLAAFGPATCQAVTDAGFTLQIEAPSANAPSMSMAIDKYLEGCNNHKKK
ncbi:MAG TPA: uroporphyrinogen-III synthase [Bacteroidales bacterium]|nr:uroporphyrinogen-III synthase [Bacteroidales bacterium]HRZ48015.1 uroporphyrinogen-III synthase [Bacteroidales bacterium]